MTSATGVATTSARALEKLLDDQKAPVLTLAEVAAVVGACMYMFPAWRCRSAGCMHASTVVLGACPFVTLFAEDAAA